MKNKDDTLLAFDDSIKEKKEKVDCLKAEYNSIGKAIAELNDSIRCLESTRSSYILDNKMIGDDGVYAIAYSPICFGGCEDLLKVIILNGCTKTLRGNGIQGRVITYSYFDGEYSFDSADGWFCVDDHEKYENNGLIYRIKNEHDFNNMCIDLIKNNFTLEEIHKYMGGLCK
jgi:hypothetical protein